MHPFAEFINNLSDNELASLATGQSKLSVNYNDFLLSREGIYLSQYNENNLKRKLIDNQQSILEQLHKIQPLSCKEFNFQAIQLIMNNSPNSFSHHSTKNNKRALMIVGDILIVVEENDVRLQYGYFYNQTNYLSKEETHQAVIDWVDSGQAYDDYRVKTHCLYICTF